MKILNVIKTTVQEERLMLTKASAVACVDHMATHKAQHHPSEVKGKALQFFNVIGPVPLAQYRDIDNVLDMDQTSVYHTVDFKSIIDKVSTRMDGVLVGEDAIVGDDPNVFVKPVLGGDDDFDLNNDDGIDNINL
jgi:hypothetical protein